MLKTFEIRLFQLFVAAFVFTTFNRELVVFGQDVRLIPATLGAATMAVIALRHFSERYRLKLRLEGTNRALLLYFVFSMLCNVAWLFSPLTLVRDQFISVFLANFLNLFHLVVLLVNRRKITWRLFATATYFAGGVMLLSMFAVFMGVDLRNYASYYTGSGSDGISETIFGPVRYAGYAQDPNFASLFIVVILGVAFYDVFKLKKYAYSVFILAAIFGYLLAFSKAIFVMLIVAVLAVLINRFTVGALAKELLLIGAITGSILSSIPGVVHISQPSLYLRTLLWQGAMGNFWNSPIFGNGLTAARSSNLKADWAVQIHSGVIQSLMEVGVIGLVLLFFAIRHVLLSGSRVQVFVVIAYLGTCLTYETMSHSFSVLVLGLLPLAVRNRERTADPSASVYVINGLNYGGAERVVKNMALITSSEEKVFIYTLIDPKGLEYGLPSNVEVTAIGTSGRKIFTPFYVWKLNRKLEDNWNLYRVTLATAHLPFAQIVTRLTRFSDDFLYVNHGMYGLTPDSNGAKLSRWIYNHHRMSAVSRQLLEEEVKENYRIKASDEFVIYNPLDTAGIDIALAELSTHSRPKSDKKIISVGRYVTPKNLADGIVAFDKSGLAVEGYRYELYGEGELRDDLQQIIDERGLEDSVKLMGFTDNPFQEMATAECMLHPASYEAFPMALIEAHYCGCRIAAYDVPFGAREVMPGRLREFLAPFGDTDALARILRRAVEGTYPAEESTPVIEKIRPQVVMQQYYDAYAQSQTNVLEPESLVVKSSSRRAEGSASMKRVR